MSLNPRSNTPSDDPSWETDAVWKLLEQSPPPAAGPRFADDTLRAARLAGQALPWWKNLLSPLPVGVAGAAVTAAIALGFFLSPRPTGTTPGSIATHTGSEHIAAIEEFAETEALLAAMDQLDDYSDHELVTLIGF